MYQAIKLIHIGTALLTVGGFLLRGFWMLRSSPLLEQKAARILPHIIDTLFLLSGVVLVVQLGGNVMIQPWMLVKVAALVAYIILGTIALRRGKTLQIRATAFVAALAVFAYAYGVAIARSPASWLAILAN